MSPRPELSGFGVGVGEAGSDYMSADLIKSLMAQQDKQARELEKLKKALQQSNFFIGSETSLSYLMFVCLLIHQDFLKTSIIMNTLLEDKNLGSPYFFIICVILSFRLIVLQFMYILN